MPSVKLYEKLFDKLLRYYRQQTGNTFDPVKSYKTGDVVFSTGEKPKGIYYLTKGWVKIIQECEQGEKPVLRLAGSNEFIGYVSLLKKQHYTSSAIVVEEADIQFIPKQIFLKLLQTNVEFTNTVIDILCERITSDETRLLHLISKDGKQRLAALLLSLELAYDEDPTYDHSFIRLPKKDIASAIAITPETMSRYLAEFKNKGYIRLTGEGIEVTNKSALLYLSNVKD